MRRFILFFAFAAMLSTVASGWGRLGHATIAEIAERHLAPKAKSNIAKYTHGTPLADYASWMDVVSGTLPYKDEFRGWHASVCTPDCRSPLYIRKEVRDCRDGVTAMEFFREYLKDYKEMPDSLVLQAIKCIVHIVGDFHCPSHVRYSDEVNELLYKVKFFGKEGKLHAVWDTGLIQQHSGFTHNDYREYADRLDTWKKCRIRKVSRGWAREWFEDCAADVRPTIRTVPEGAEIGQEFVDANYALAELELRKAGYRLAAALNTVFGK